MAAMRVSAITTVDCVDFKSVWTTLLEVTSRTEVHKAYVSQFFVLVII